MIDRWETRQTTIWGRYGSSWPKTDERIMEARGNFETTVQRCDHSFFCFVMIRLESFQFWNLKFESLQQKKNTSFNFTSIKIKSKTQTFCIAFFFINIYLSKILTDEQRNKMSFLTESGHFFVCLIFICLFAFLLKKLLVCFNVV